MYFSYSLVWLINTQYIREHVITHDNHFGSYTHQFQAMKTTLKCPIKLETPYTDTTHNRFKRRPVSIHIPPEKVTVLCTYIPVYKHKPFSSSMYDCMTLRVL